MTWFIVYCIGIVVGVIIDNIFWYAVARIKEYER